MDDIKIEYLSGNGGYDTPECIEFLKECDVVVTNPPFSLFRDYVKCLMNYGKKFIIMANKNAITYKEIFPLIKNNQIWVGYTSLNGGRWMIIPNDIEVISEKIKINGNERLVNVAGVCWFTNVEHSKRNIPIDLYKKYNPEEYPKYDNYDAIEVSKTCEIPMDYEGVMGVPITFLDKYCPSQFEIVGIANSARWIGDFPCLTIIQGKKIYNRILIKRISQK